MTTKLKKDLRIAELLEAEARYIARIRELEQRMALIAGYCVLNDTRETRTLNHWLLFWGIRPEEMLFPGEPEPRDQRSMSIHETVKEE